MFDVAGNVLLAEVEGGREQTRRTIALDASDPQARASQLAGLGTNVLICGAISWPLEMAVSAAGVEVIAQTCGDVEEVLAAFVQGQLGREAFLMPGCCGRHRRFQAGRRGGRCWRHGQKGGDDHAQR